MHGNNLLKNFKLTDSGSDKNRCCLNVLLTMHRNTVRSESRCALRLQYVDLVVSNEVAIEVCCCFTAFSC
jgi:hypothetical protein